VGHVHGETWVTERREITVRTAGRRRLPDRLDAAAHGRRQGPRTHVGTAANNEYSGLSYRSLRCMDKGVLLDSEGRNDPKAILGQPAAGRTTAESSMTVPSGAKPDRAGVAMFDHRATRTTRSGGSA